MRSSEIFTVAFAALAASADVPNTVVNLQNCQSLGCNPPNNSICSTGDSAGPPIGIGIAANAVSIPSTKLSFTLVNGLDENGFTGIGSSQYEHSDQQLFVGLDPNLKDNNYPSGCVLMMQYLAQTFPLESFVDKDGTRADMYKNTTSCDGVVDTICQSSIASMIRDFNTTESKATSSDDKCTLLTSHVNARLQENAGTCGGEGTWIANFMNVTGGALPDPKSDASQDGRLGSAGCHAVLPANYELHKVAAMRQLYFADPPSSGSDFYSKIYGGVDGYTPVITVVYSGDQMSEISDGDLQFSCLQTFKPDGEAQQDIFESAGINISAGVSRASLLATVISVTVVLFV